MQKIFSHQPPPWKASGNTVVSASKKYGWKWTDLICQCSHHPDQVEEAAQIAVFLSAAPEMFAACLLALETTTDEETKNALTAAINKAQGI